MKNEELKVGSIVRLSRKEGDAKTSIVGETPTQWKVGKYEQRFRKEDLCKVGAGRWECSSISLWSEEDEKLFQRHKYLKGIRAMINKIANIPVGSLTEEQVAMLEAVLVLSEENKGE